MSITWGQFTSIISRSYTCGYCGNALASNHGCLGEERELIHGRPVARHHFIYICHFCSSPTYFDLDGGQTPGMIFGEAVQHLPAEVENLYQEARMSYSANAYTASVLCSRKLLMNISVSQGAAQGDSFKSYVDWLAANHFLPRGGEKWTDLIRDKGNEATHEIPNMK